MELFDLVSCQRDKLPDFLREYGHQDYLKKMVLTVEQSDQKIYGYPKHIFKSYFTNIDKNIYVDYIIRTHHTIDQISDMGISYELPTIELCHVLTDIITYAGTAKLREVGAGTGLLSKMLGFHLTIPIKTTDKYGGRGYVNVIAETFEKTILEQNEDIIISWLHPSVEELFLKMIENNQPNNIWHIGQLAGKKCFSYNFITRMNKLGYGYMPINAKQFSHIDYFIEEKGGGIGNTSRTSISWFSKKFVSGDFPITSEICHKEDLTSLWQERKPIEYLDEYYPCMSDMEYEALYKTLMSFV